MNRRPRVSELGVRILRELKDAGACCNAIPAWELESLCFSPPRPDLGHRRNRERYMRALTALQKRGYIRRVFTSSNVPMYRLTDAGSDVLRELSELGPVITVRG
jgi:hypothetical protein